MKNLLSFIGVFFLKQAGRLPFSILYMIADVLYFILRFLIRYRKKTIFSNLRNAFPEKETSEIKKIAKGFYRHLADLMVETLKAYQISEKELNERFHFRNPEIFNELYKQQKNVALISGHYGNWEWTSILPKFIPHQVNVIYRTIQNEAYDHYMRDLRSRFGMFMIPAAVSLRTLLDIKKSGQLSATYYLTDQTAYKDTDYWMLFLGQESAIFPGVEKVASKMKEAIVFMDIQKIKRGYYVIEFTKLFDDASLTKPYEVTKTHTKFLEDIIRKRPELWLWSHRRWKHTRPEHITLK
jgi:KDO2-lipid IV(A) lauroyltransferase